MKYLIFNKKGRVSSWQNDVLRERTISDNTERRGGGLFLLQRSNMEISGKIFIYNGYVKDGGAIYLNNCHDIRIHDCLFLCNIAKWGGGIYVEKSRNIEMRCNVFLFNFALRDGGAISISHSDKISLDENYFLGNISLRRNRNVDIFHCTNVKEKY
jgi:hypothetical protein